MCTKYWLLSIGWSVGCIGFSGRLRQYFNLYRAVSQREGERGERIEESKNVQTTPTRTYCKRNRPLPYYHPNCRTPWHRKFTQVHRTTRPPPGYCRHWLDFGWQVGCLGLTTLWDSISFYIERERKKRNIRRENIL